jgi:hypothetical protein
MAFIGRRLDNSIYGVWSVPQPNDADHPRVEEVAEDHPDLVAFRTPKPPIDFSNVDNVERGLRALALCFAEVGGLTGPAMKALFKQKWDQLS